MEIDIRMVERARVRKGLLRYELAKSAEITPATVYKVFRSGRCGMRVARQIAKALGLDLGKMIKLPAEDQQEPDSGRASAVA